MSIMVDPEVTSGDYLDGFWQGTRQALYDNGRESITITVKEVSPEVVGMLIALFERAVGLYASLININAYHQPGVEAGKKAASSVIDLQRKTLECLTNSRSRPTSLDQIVQSIGSADNAEGVFLICEHLAANPDHKVTKVLGSTPSSAQYQIG